MLLPSLGLVEIVGNRGRVHSNLKATPTRSAEPSHCSSDPTPLPRRETLTLPVSVQHKPRDSHLSSLHYAKIEMEMYHRLLLRPGLRSLLPHQRRFRETPSCLPLEGGLADVYVRYEHEVRTSETQGAASQAKVSVRRRCVRMVSDCRLCGADGRQHRPLETLPQFHHVIAARL